MSAIMNYCVFLLYSVMEHRLRNGSNMYVPVINSETSHDCQGVTICHFLLEECQIPHFWGFNFLSNCMFQKIYQTVNHPVNMLPTTPYIPGMCLPGTYTTKWNTCDDCPVGTYSDSTGVKECSSCPEYQTTPTTGATGMEQCQGRIGF